MSKFEELIESIDNPQVEGLEEAIPIPKPTGAPEVYQEVLKMMTAKSLAIRAVVTIEKLILAETDKKSRFYVVDAMAKILRRGGFDPLANLIYDVLATAAQRKTEAEGAGWSRK